MRKERSNMTITQISAYVDNRQGSLHEIIDVLGKSGVDIRALSLADTTNYGVLRLILDDPEKAKTALEEHGFSVSSNRVIGIGVADSPGGLEKPLKLLMDAGIAVEYVYAFIGKANDSACVILRVDDTDRALALLKENGVLLLEGVI